jgi:adenylate kinase family enzyme
MRENRTSGSVRGAPGDRSSYRASCYGVELYDDIGLSYFRIKRVAVVGTSCVGKTTFARKLSTCLGVCHIELDALFWQPEWVERPVSEFKLLIEQETSVDHWVADGNYSPVRDIVLGRATDIIWLNYSFPLVLSRALSRTVSRILTREELFSGNRESLRQSFFSRDSILFWVLKTFRRNRVKYVSLKSSDEWRHLKFREFWHSSEASAFLSQWDVDAQQDACS